MIKKYNQFNEHILGTLTKLSTLPIKDKVPKSELILNPVKYLLEVSKDSLGYSVNNLLYEIYEKLKIKNGDISPDNDQRLDISLNDISKTLSYVILGNFTKESLLEIPSEFYHSDFDMKTFLSLTNESNDVREGDEIIMINSNYGIIRGVAHKGMSRSDLIIELDGYDKINGAVFIVKTETYNDFIDDVKYYLKPLE